MKRKKIIVLAALLGLLTACDTPAPVRDDAEAVVAVAVNAAALLETFLRDFTPLFSYGHYWAEEEVYRDWDYMELTGRPLVWTAAEHVGRYFDHAGDLIEKAPFIRGQHEAIAMDYSLYHLDDDGIPEILMRWRKNADGFLMRTLYRYENGAYTEAGVFRGWGKFYRDETGRPMVLYIDQNEKVYGFYHLNFSNGGMTEEPLLAAAAATADWDMLRWGDYRVELDENPAPVAFGTKMQLTECPELTDLRTEITDSIIKSLPPHAPTRIK